MADTKEKIIGKIKVPILLGSDNRFSVQNLSGNEVFVSRKDLGVQTGLLKVGDGAFYDYDIDLWCKEDSNVSEVGIVRYV